MQDPGTGDRPLRGPESDGPERESGICAAVRTRILDLLAGDLPAAMRRELSPHAQSCPRCRTELESFSGLISELRALPVSASAARTWSGIERAIAAERHEQPVPWLVQVLALAAAGLVVASALVRHSAAVAERLSAPPELARWLLPACFILFGAMSAVAALPLFTAHGRAAPASAP